MGVALGRIKKSVIFIGQKKYVSFKLPWESPSSPSCFLKKPLEAGVQKAPFFEVEENLTMMSRVNGKMQRLLNKTHSSFQPD